MSIRWMPTASWAATPGGLRAALAASRAPRASAAEDGGIEFDGRDLSPLDGDAVARFLGRVAGDAQAVAITSVFAPVSARHELLAAEIVKRELGDVHVSLSHEVGSLGLLGRENATILNGALTGVAHDVATAMRAALDAHELRPATFFAQNDGTLMGLDHALRYPVLTIGSGPANRPGPTRARSRSWSWRRYRWRISHRPRSGSASRRPAPSAAWPGSACRRTRPRPGAWPASSVPPRS
jgi:hypothetical protein